MSDNNKYDTMPFPFDSPSPLPTQSDGLRVGLRDYFAGQALAGIMANAKLVAVLAESKQDPASCAYEMADYMLAERQKERK